MDVDDPTLSIRPLTREAGAMLLPLEVDGMAGGISGQDMELHVSIEPMFLSVLCNGEESAVRLHRAERPNKTVLCLSYLPGIYVIGSTPCMNTSKRWWAARSHHVPLRPSWDIAGHGLRHACQGIDSNQPMGPNRGL